MSLYGLAKLNCTSQQTELTVLHVPKTSTSFVVAVLKLDCPGLPLDWMPSCGSTKALRPNAICDVVDTTIPYGSGTRPFISGYQRGSMEISVRQFSPIVCCSSMSSLVRFHNPLPYPVPADTKLVVMLRRGKQRLLSAFYAGLHVGGEQTFDPAQLRALYTTVTCPAAFARFDGVSNCQTKMLLGCRCSSDCDGIGNASAWTHAHSAALSRARRVLDGAFHIGLTEMYEKSVRLLHHRLGLHARGGSHWTQMMANVRPGVAANHTYDERTLDVGHTKAWSATQPWTNCSDARDHAMIRWGVESASLEQLDQALYEYAKRLFGHAAAWHDAMLHSSLAPGPVLRSSLDWMASP